MKRKVYCKNCKFEKSEGRPLTHRDYCIRDIKINKYTMYITGEEHDFTINEHGLCPHYQKKGWKFWVK